MTSLDSVPRELWDKIPAARPPPGVVPNFVDPPSGGPTLIAVGTVLLFIMLVFAGIRFYSKAVVRRKVTPDDCKWPSRLVLWRQEAAALMCADELASQGRRWRPWFVRVRMAPMQCASVLLRCLY